MKHKKNKKKRANAQEKINAIFYKRQIQEFIGHKTQKRLTQK